MRSPPVLLDPRTEENFFDDALKLAQAYCSSWPLSSVWPSAEGPTQSDIASDPGLALIKLFSLLAGHLANTENRLPAHRQLALYRLLDVTLRAAEAATVPLQFTLVPNRPAQLVSQGTAVADSATRSIRFETQTDLVAIPATMCAAVTVAPSLDRYINVQDAVDESEGVSLFIGEQCDSHERWLGHYLLLSDPTLFKPNPATRSIKIAIHGENLDPDYFARWYDGALNPLPCTVTASADLSSCVAEVTFPQAPSCSATDLHSALCAASGLVLPNVDIQDLGDVSTPLFWLIGQPREYTRVVPALEGYLPSIADLTCCFGPMTVLPQQAAFNTGLIDIANGAYPFGRIPAPFDAIYLRCDAGFAHPGVAVSLMFRLRELGPGYSAYVEWQFWSGDRWQPFRDPSTGTNPYDFSDSTQNLTNGVTSAVVSFNCPEMEMQTVASTTGRWIRAVLVSGDYTVTGAKGLVVNAPFIQSVHITFDQSVVPSGLWRDNAFTVEPVAVDTPFCPYRPVPDIPGASCSLYLGFAFATQALLESSLGCQLSLYFDVATEGDYASAALSFEWFDAGTLQWQPIDDVMDDTFGFAQSGAIGLTIPVSMSEALLFSTQACWFRISTANRRDAIKVRGIYPNSVLARNLTLYTNEILGSSSGMPDQTFILSHAGGQAVPPGAGVPPRNVGVQPDIELQILEPVALSGGLANGVGSQTRAVQWRRVDSFSSCTPDERVYMLDAYSGQITFGDGVNGMAPPAGVSNVIATRYATTNGKRGNVDAGLITALRSGGAGIASVTNPIASRGGADGDVVEDLLKSGPARVRANDRVVSLSDLEAMCMMVSARVWRARALEITVDNFAAMKPDEDLTVAEQRALPRIEIYVLLASSEPAPYAPTWLLNDIWVRLQRLCGVQLQPRIAMTTASFKRIDIEAVLETDLRATEWKTLEQTVTKLLSAFLHPVTGGSDQTGWAFGQRVGAADVLSLLDGMTQVGVTRVLLMTVCGSLLGADVPPHAVAVAGEIRLTFQAG
jgi:hypothetical protein